jgi:hypothetical protein
MNGVVSKWIKASGSLLFHYRNKIFLTSVLAVILAIIVSYYETWNPLLMMPQQSKRRGNKLMTVMNNQSIIPSMSTGNRSRVLLRLRRQYDSSCRHFLPTLRKKIFAIVDINATVKQIKELRTVSAPGCLDLERALWEEIKVSSFTLLFVAVYMTTTVCTVLRIQVHILARSILNSDQQDSRTSNGEDEMNMDNQVCFLH